MRTSLILFAVGTLIFVPKIGAAERPDIRQKPIIQIDKSELRSDVREKYNGPMLHEKMAAIREAKKELRAQVRQEIAATSLSISVITLDVRQELNESLEQAKLTSKEQARKVADEIKNLRAAARKGEQ